MTDDAGIISDPEEYASLPFEDDDSTTGPEASSTAPLSEGTTSDVGDPGGEGVAWEFDPRHREAFEGLLYLGALTDEFHWLGHTFVIRSLTVGETLEVGLIHRQYRNSLGDSRAYVTAMVAASILSVDGRPLPQPLTRDPSDTRLHSQFTYVKDNWYPWVVDKIYSRVVLLEQRVEGVLEAMGEAERRTA